MFFTDTNTKILHANLHAIVRLLRKEPNLTSLL